jgi:hypothetical protein
MTHWQKLQLPVDDVADRVAKRQPCIPARDLGLAPAGGLSCCCDDALWIWSESHSCLAKSILLAASISEIPSF